MPATNLPRNALTNLRKLLVNHFTVEELRVLSFDLGVEYEDLEGPTKTTKMQGLIRYLDRRGRLRELLDAAAEERPNVDWPNPEAARLKVASTLSEVDSYTQQKTGLVMLQIPEGEFLFGDEKRLRYLPEY